MRTLLNTAFTVLSLAALVVSSGHWVMATPLPNLPAAFQQHSAKAKVIVLEFSTPWCSSCRAIAPEIEAMRRTFGDQVAILAVDLSKPANERYQAMFGIDSTPTFMLFTGQGKALSKLDSDISGPQLKARIQAALKQG